MYDPCCGTGGFIVAAIERLFKLAGNDQSKRKNIKRKQICGCELRSDMYTYACSNMRFRGDGKSNLYNGDCFNHETIIRENHKPTVAFLNPPYGKTVSPARQMEFVEHALRSLEPTADGRVVAIVQMSCAIKDDKELKIVKERILKNHHLKAVLSMPDDLFYPVGVVTCIMVFEANKPNSGRKSWFGYFKDDGFEKRKGLGRIDARNRYAAINRKWLSAYRNMDEVPGLSVRHEVTANDEWCAEAYMETDYSTLTDETFINTMRNYAAYRVTHSKGSVPFSFSNAPIAPDAILLNTARWKWFGLGDDTSGLFEVSGTQTTPKVELEEHGIGDYPYVTTQATNNGVEGFYAYATENANVLCVDSAVAGYCSYQQERFSASDHVEKLTPKFALNKFTATFLVTIINHEQYRFNYGRKCSQKKLKATKIRLPATQDGKPDWGWIENYIKGLPYSAAL